jgi:hypothetical protein
MLERNRVLVIVHFPGTRMGGQVAVVVGGWAWRGMVVIRGCRVT